MSYGYNIIYLGAALVTILPLVLSFVLLGLGGLAMNDTHLVLCSERCSLDACLCDCHQPQRRWVRVDRVAYFATRLILAIAVIYILAVILAVAWTRAT